MKAYRPLLLWDVDGTLLHNPDSGGPSAEQEFLTAVASVVGRRPLHPPQRTHGSTDYAIIHSILSNSWFDQQEAEKLFPQILQTLQQQTTDKQYLDRSRSPVAGAEQTLKALQPLAIQSYATGNSPARAREKLAHFSLDRFLDQQVGGFGDWTAQRSRFIARAIRLANKKYCQYYLQPVVIGDTPYDLYAAQELGLPSIAVSAGVFSTSELASCNPQLVLEDLSNPEAIIDFLTADPRFGLQTA